MSRQAEVRFRLIRAGWLEENGDGFAFRYDPEWLERPDAEPVSFTLPMRSEPYVSKTMLPFFDGLIPEGWLLDVAARNWKLDPRDRMGLLLSVCGETIGAVTIHPVP
jgi:serine/threonine-protein kinase HipA